jgi:hypothetical protein
VFLSARALRGLVALPAEARLAALAALDPATHRHWRHRQVPPEDGDGEPGAA